MEKKESLLSTLREACEKIDFNFETASKEVQELIGDLKIIDYYVTTEVPSEFFKETLMDSCILTENTLLGYEVKQGNISLYHMVPLSKITLVSERLTEVNGEKYIVTFFHAGDPSSLGTSAKFDNRKMLRKFVINVNKYIK